MGRWDVHKANGCQRQEIKVVLPMCGRCIIGPLYSTSRIGCFWIEKSTWKEKRDTEAFSTFSLKSDLNSSYLALASFFFFWRSIGFSAQSPIMKLLLMGIATAFQAVEKARPNAKSFRTLGEWKASKCSEHIEPQDPSLPQSLSNIVIA